MADPKLTYNTDPILEYSKPEPENKEELGPRKALVPDDQLGPRRSLVPKSERSNPKLDYRDVDVSPDQADY